MLRRPSSIPRGKLHLYPRVCRRIAPFTAPSTARCATTETSLSGESTKIPYYQPVAALEMFRWTLLGLGIPDGNLRVSANYSSTWYANDGNAAHTESFVALSSTTSSSVSMGSSSTAVTTVSEVVKWL
ncbi:uncharacterized protein L3040_009125 [Drepanopeziza brunnea f. sp. 'multigermtubi']|uniref:uncharacterized protein n=1 Tax=Drepanopeziza brunnea f. sp. 'multigermtubi' TaxID=698441 RepID=UPI00238DD8A4|nr:hypothetical protein L3040_009125 [Drepanopeziza brunnea f. sp. 'multigermtubi']